MKLYCDFQWVGVGGGVRSKRTFWDGGGWIFSGTSYSYLIKHQLQTDSTVVPQRTTRQ